MLVTGGAGFIGSHFVELAVRNECQVIVLDAMTYAGNEVNLKHLSGAGDVKLIIGNICDQALVASLFKEYDFWAVVNFAAESHVDRSISGPAEFIQTNVVGTFNLLQQSLEYWESTRSRPDFRFLHVSTDEVFGELGGEGFFTEESPYAPRSPYSASKASADHLVAAWFHTYGLPTIITNCSNNYGPRQYPEKLIPLMIENALKRKPLPVYGRGQNIRDWIYVTDHCVGIWLALTKGKIGDSFCFGGRSERKNLDVVTAICDILDEVKPLSVGEKYSQLITFVEDRLGHDFRYAIDDRKAENVLGFTRKYSSFELGLRETVNWYVRNQDWCDTVRSK